MFQDRTDQFWRIKQAQKHDCFRVCNVVMQDSFKLITAAPSRPVLYVLLRLIIGQWMTFEPLGGLVSGSLSLLPGHCCGFIKVPSSIVGTLGLALKNCICVSCVRVYFDILFCLPWGNSIDSTWTWKTIDYQRPSTLVFFHVMSVHVTKNCFGYFVAEWSPHTVISTPLCNSSVNVLFSYLNKSRYHKNLTDSHKR